MTPREKAKELVDKMFNHYGDNYYFDYELAKEYALIAVDEILKVVPQYFNDSIETIKGSVPVKVENCAYYEWLEVRKEIEAL